MPPKKRAPKKAVRNIRAAAKQTAKQAKNIKRNLKEVAKQAKRVVKAVKSAAKKTPKRKPRAPREVKPNEDGVYQLRSAPYSGGRTVLGKFASIERNAERFDQLKAPGEYWAVNIFGYRTKRLFRTAERMHSYMMRYEVFGDRRPEEQQKMIDEIEIMRFGGTTKEYMDDREAEASERKEINRKTQAGLGERYGAKVKNERTGRMRRKNSFDFLRDQQAEIDRIQATINERVQAAIAEAIKGLTPQPEPPKPKEPKKKAAKKTVKVSKPRITKAMREAAKRRSDAAKRGAETRRKNRVRAEREAKRLAKKRSEAAKRAAATRKANREAAIKAAKKGAKRR